MSLTALVLAGSRGPGDPLAVYAGVSHKALIEVGGRPMLERVVAALSAVAGISRIVVAIEIPEQLRESASLRAAAGNCELQVIDAADSPSASVAAGLRRFGTPLLVTTADHALLRPEWLRYFIDHLPRDVDACAALARSEAVLQALPQTQRTWLRFRDARYSGCNLFYFATPAAIGIAHTWRAFEAERKQPLKMVARLGWGVALRYVFGRLTLDAALARLGQLADARLAIVELPFGLAAVDVDKPSDLDLVRGISASDS
ncbi:MAG: MobA-like transferase protein [Hydrocarboniphaga sp.]|uniref:nucleotidyltransferase family protein n=1 Tax=Hydrocarboniphaga sp. TaxID=2033016 RepID=UPI002632498C|nr:nucleotidyltransferase family protein [Hydrocarboniphaga sp.]MDB5968137.1 MobA-like transferase protein [Hydrocarboniphaga sp.]